jgi:hypothetical protein
LRETPLPYFLQSPEGSLWLVGAIKDEDGIGSFLEPASSSFSSTWQAILRACGKSPLDFSLTKASVASASKIELSFLASTHPHFGATIKFVTSPLKMPKKLIRSMEIVWVRCSSHLMPFPFRPQAHAPA